jgi:hypothetical protein
VFRDTQSFSIWPKIRRSRARNACEGHMVDPCRTVAPPGLPGGYSGAGWRIHGRGGMRNVQD